MPNGYLFPNEMFHFPMECRFGLFGGTAEFYSQGAANIGLLAWRLRSVGSFPVSDFLNDDGAGVTSNYRYSYGRWGHVANATDVIYTYGNATARLNTEVTTFTFAIVFQPKTLPTATNTGVLLSRKNSTTTNDFTYLFEYDANGDLHFYTNSSTNVRANAITVTGGVEKDRWHIAYCAKEDGIAANMAVKKQYGSWETATGTTSTANAVVTTANSYDFIIGDKVNDAAAPGAIMGQRVDAYIGGWTWWKNRKIAQATLQQDPDGLEDHFGAPDYLAEGPGTGGSVMTLGGGMGLPGVGKKRGDW